MSKTKPQTNGKVAKSAPAVKDAGVKKSLQKPAVKAKDLAKATAAKAAPKEEKKSKKSKKAPTPEPESESESDDSEAADSDDSESDDEPAPKANGVKKAAAAESSDEDSEEDSDESEDEKPAPAKAAKKVNGTAAKPAAKAESDDSEDDDEDDSDDSDDEPAVHQTKAGAAADDTSDESDSSEDEEEAPAKKASKVNGAAKDEDEEDDSDDSDDSDESEEEEAPSKKRKADAVSTPAAKKTKTEPTTPAEGNGVKNLFVGGLSWNIDEEWLAREFEEYGEVVGSRIITDRETQRSKGYGYVEFADAESAANALKARHESMLDGRQIRVDFSTPRPKNDDATPRDRSNQRANKFGDATGNPTETLFCGNLSFDCTSEAVSEAFEEFGSITSVRLPTDRETGAPKGFGYISFGTVDEAKAALEAMQGQSIAGRNCRLDYAQPRDPNSSGGGQRGGRGGFGGGRGRGGFGDRGGRGGGRGRGGFGDRGGRGGRGGFTTNRGGFGDFKGNKVSFD